MRGEHRQHPISRLGKQRHREVKEFACCLLAGTEPLPTSAACLGNPAPGPSASSQGAQAEPGLLGSGSGPGAAAGDIHEGMGAPTRSMGSLGRTWPGSDPALLHPPHPGSAPLTPPFPLVVRVSGYLCWGLAGSNLHPLWASVSPQRKDTMTKACQRQCWDKFCSPPPPLTPGRGPVN